MMEDKFPTDNVEAYLKGWNAAIEAAANKAEANGTMCVAMEIRKLKK